MADGNGRPFHLDDDERVELGVGVVAARIEDDGNVFRRAHRIVHRGRRVVDARHSDGERCGRGAACPVRDGIGELRRRREARRQRAEFTVGIERVRPVWRNGEKAAIVACNRHRRPGNRRTIGVGDGEGLAFLVGVIGKHRAAHRIERIGRVGIVAGYRRIIDRIDGDRECPLDE